MHSSIGDIANVFRVLCTTNPDNSEAIAAIDVLTRVLRTSDVSTVQGLHGVLNEAIAEMTDTGRNHLCVKSACELFQRFITLTISEAPDDFIRCKQVLQERADLFLKKVSSCKQQIANNFINLLPDGACLLIHSYSRAVLASLTAYATSRLGSSRSSGRLHCYVTTCAPHESGRKMMKALAKLKISCTLIPDLSIAYLMPQITLVLMGAQAVVESGGILNDLGSSTVAMIASAFGKPVYVLAESFKFIRAFPLDQRHIPEEFKSTSGFSPACSPMRNLKMSDFMESVGDDDGDDFPIEDFPELHTPWAEVCRHRTRVIERTIPGIDYTYPCYISHLVTDLGVLTPSVVSDELIKLYL